MSSNLIFNQRPDSTSSIMGEITSGDSGTLLQSTGTVSPPVFTTATYPSTSGSTGNVITSNGTNFVSSAQTGLVFLTSQTASSSATLDFLNLNVYSKLFITITGMGPATAAQTLQLQVSQNNGSTWLSTGYACGNNYTTYNSAVLTNSNSTSFIPLSTNMTNSNNLSSEFYLLNMDTGAPVAIFGNSNYTDSIMGVVSGKLIGNGPTGVTALRFLYSSGNIAAGAISIFAVTES